MSSSVIDRTSGLGPPTVTLPENGVDLDALTADSAVHLPRVFERQFVHAIADCAIELAEADPDYEFGEDSGDLWTERHYHASSTINTDPDANLHQLFIDKLFVPLSKALGAQVSLVMLSEPIASPEVVYFTHYSANPIGTLLSNVHADGAYAIVCLKGDDGSFHIYKQLSGGKIEHAKAFPMQAGDVMLLGHSMRDEAHGIDLTQFHAGHNAGLSERFVVTADKIMGRVAPIMPRDLIVGDQRLNTHGYETSWSIDRQQ